MQCILVLSENEAELNTPLTDHIYMYLSAEIFVKFIILDLLCVYNIMLLPFIFVLFNYTKSRGLIT